jgi:hypothetical protein
MKRSFLVPIAWLAVAAASTASAGTGEGSRNLLFPGAAVVRLASGASFEEAVPAVSAEVLRLGRLVEGVAEVAALRTVSVGAGRHTVGLVQGVARLGVAGDEVDVCADEGSVRVGAEIVAEGSCVRFTGTDPAVPLDPAAAQLHVPSPPPPVPPAPSDDDPGAVGERLVGESAAGEGEGSGEGSEAGGAAACLDTGGTGSEATGPDGGELPETEIDRSHHRVDVHLTLEGY